ncbi:metalloregulator ArsR/SmtB family transcription factor [Vagococcus sp. CY53-2]|uniref:ArsR/SmtB family transcription factor n=1 Tax=Vagococcus sp. CY53-2 TaxID=2925780 RepID=UPI001F50EDF3|nr:metalloregulator ArsR/SmtB family transcription factor [Vagococcus sp. CY53-2]MCI0129955.1 metalloregulator ArsR/SmtB family transcription factor [Vagococcus sp. CY53-2]
MKELNPQTIQQTSRFFKTIGDSTRLKILVALSEKEMNVSSITEFLDMEQSAVSHQLKLLRENHLVKSRKEGKSVVYCLDDKHVKSILTQTFDHMNHINHD